MEPRAKVSLRSAAGVSAAVIAAATVVVAAAVAAAVVAVAPTAASAAGEENNQDNDDPEATIVSAHIFEPFLRTRQYSVISLHTRCGEVCTQQLSFVLF